MKIEKVKYIKRIVIKNLWGEVDIDWKLYDKDDSNPDESVPNKSEHEWVHILYGDNGSGKSTILDIIEKVLKNADVPKGIDVDYVEIEFDSNKKIKLKKIETPEDQLSSALIKRQEIEKLRSQHQNEKESIAKLNAEYLLEVMLDYATKYRVEPINFFNDINSIEDKVKAKRIFNESGISTFVNVVKVKTFDMPIESESQEKLPQKNTSLLASMLANSVNSIDTQSRKSDDLKESTELNAELKKLITGLKNYRLSLQVEIESKISEKEKEINNLLEKDSPTTEEQRILKSLILIVN